MIQDEIPISAQSIQWRCIESEVESKRLHYGRSAISPSRRGQANTVGIAMRRALLGEVEGTSITYAKFKGIKHEYATIAGIQETIHDILINPREIVIRSDSYEVQEASISVIGPKRITAGDILSPSSVEIIDDSQYIATITQAMPVDIESRIEKDRGYRIQDPKESQDEGFPIDAAFMPVRNVNHSVHSFENDREIREILLIEIWTNGSSTPNEALYEASRNPIDLFIPFLHTKKEEISYGKDDDYESNPKDFPSSSISTDIDRMAKEVAFKHIFIDQSESPARAYNCPKRIDVHTISDLPKYSQDDSRRIKNFGKKSVDQVLKALRERFAIDLPKNRSYVD